MNTTFVDTHCHLNFKRFNKTRDEVVTQAKQEGVSCIVVPGTEVSSSKKAVEIAAQYEHVYAAVGIHPHHTIEKIQIPNSNQNQNQIEEDILELEKLIIHPKVVAVGEIGLDRHEYEITKYENYTVSEEFFNSQKEYFKAQIRLAQQYKKALIIHNRETKKELLEIVSLMWTDEMRFRTVFHCCEPDGELLEYAIAHNIYIGIDGDVTYGEEKAEFAKKVPLEILVLETDAPFLLPEPLKTQKLYPNTPANIPLIVQCIAQLKGVSVEEVAQVTTENAKRLFKIDC